MKTVFSFIFLFVGLIALSAEHHGKNKELPACCADGCCCTGADTCTGCACTKDQPTGHESASTHDKSSPQVCVVSGEELGSMGDPVAYTHHVHGGEDVQLMFCCKRCVERFESDPEKYLSKHAETATACCADGKCSNH